MNILYGLYQPDEGEILVQGRKVKLSGPSQAISLGIGMVHQHFMLVPRLTVAENVVLGSEPRRGIRLDRRKAAERVNKLSEEYRLKVDPFARVAELSVGIQQRVEILKCLYRKADILILDEPTAVLTPQETRELFTVLRSLVERGKTIIFITHKLDEVMEISDHVTVLRRGQVVGSMATSETDKAELARMMVGREIVFSGNRRKTEQGDPILEVSNLTVNDRQGVPRVKGVSFTVRAGEILGIAGVDGNGQHELIEAITGLQPVSGGRVVLGGIDITRKGVKFIREAGLAHIPEDRHKRGLILDFSVAENLVLGLHWQQRFARRCLINHASIIDFSEEAISRFDIRTPGRMTAARMLSGGNQQKVVIARELSYKPSLLVAAQPTRGLDIGATQFVRDCLLRVKEQGGAVLLVSFDLDEVMSLSDRIVVLHGGSIVGTVNPDTVTRETLGLLMAGVKSA